MSQMMMEKIHLMWCVSTPKAKANETELTSMELEAAAAPHPLSLKKRHPYIKPVQLSFADANSSQACAAVCTPG